MENRKRSRPKNEKKGLFTRLFLDTASHPEAIENQDWYLDSPDLRLTRIFSVVLVLHIIAVGGILASKMINKAVPPSGALSQTSSKPRETAVMQKNLAGKVNRPESPTNAQVEYQVIAGDTLASIAAKLRVDPDGLRRVNGLSNPNDILPGMWLHLPLAESVAPNSRADSKKLPSHSTESKSNGLLKGTSSTVRSSGVVYAVQKGDTVWGIAQKFRIDPNHLIRLNGIDRPQALQLGRLLEIPAQ